MSKQKRTFEPTHVIVAAPGEEGVVVMKVGKLVSRKIGAPYYSPGLQNRFVTREQFEKRAPPVWSTPDGTSLFRRGKPRPGAKLHPVRVVSIKSRFRTILMPGASRKRVEFVQLGRYRFDPPLAVVEDESSPGIYSIDGLPIRIEVREIGDLGSSVLEQISGAWCCLVEQAAPRWEQSTGLGSIGREDLQRRVSVVSE